MYSHSGTDAAQNKLKKNNFQPTKNENEQRFSAQYQPKGNNLNMSSAGFPTFL